MIFDVFMYIFRNIGGNVFVLIFVEYIWWFIVVYVIFDNKILK